jgi:hypothetical protein
MNSSKDFSELVNIGSAVCSGKLFASIRLELIPNGTLEKLSATSEYKRKNI